MASGKKTDAEGSPEKQSSDGGAAKPSTAKSTAKKASSPRSKTSKVAGGTKTDAPVSSASAAAKKAPAKADATDTGKADSTPLTKASSTAATAHNPSASVSTATTDDAKPADMDPARKDPKAAFQPTRNVIAKSTDSIEAAPPAKQPEAAPQQSGRSGGVFWPLVLGGVVAAVLGFAASEANLLNFRGGNDGLQAQLDSQAQDIADLQGAVPPEVDLSGVEEQIAQLTETVQSFETRIAALEDRPTGGSGDGSANAADAADLEEMRAALEQQRSEIQRLLENALSIEDATAAAARAAAIQAGVSKITAAISSGAAFEGVVDDLRDAGVEALPQPLVDGAAEGVATLNNLQNRFPDAARDALSAARASGQSGEENGGVTAFLRRQLDARSVQPREGSDPDAVLSRAEAALQDGRVSAALEEIETLPEDAKSAMSDWIADARARAGAEAGVEDLSQSLTAN